MKKKPTALARGIDKLGIDHLVDACDPAARGIVQCLRMLAEEADSLHLTGTRAALTKAMEMCAAESHDIGAIPSGSTILPPSGGALH